MISCSNKQRSWRSRHQIQQQRQQPMMQRKRDFRLDNTADCTLHCWFSLHHWCGSLGAHDVYQRRAKQYCRHGLQLSTLVGVLPPSTICLCLVDVQERLDLLEQENDLLVGQQGDLDAELERLGGLLQQKDQEVCHGATHK